MTGVIPETLAKYAAIRSICLKYGISEHSFNILLLLAGMTGKPLNSLDIATILNVQPLEHYKQCEILSKATFISSPLTSLLSSPSSVVWQLTQNGQEVVSSFYYAYNKEYKYFSSL